MKKIFILACLLAASSVFATTDKQTRISALEKDWKKHSIRQINNTPERPSLRDLTKESIKEQREAQRELRLKQQEAEAKKPVFDVTDYILTPFQQTRAIETNTVTIHILDSVITYYPNGDPYIAIMFEFAENGWPVSLGRYFWNFGQNKWNLVDIETYEWIPNGNVGYLQHRTLTYDDGFSQRWSYTYNDQWLGDSETVTYRESPTDPWINFQKMEFTYNPQGGNPIGMLGYDADVDGISWILKMEEHAEWDQWGAQTFFESWHRDGEAVRYGDYRESRERLPYSAGDPIRYQTLLLIWNWDFEATDWVPTGRMEQRWTETKDQWGYRHQIINNNLLWNPIDQDWSGDPVGWFGPSIRDSSAWDGDRQIYEAAYEMVNKEWVLQMECLFDWNHNATTNEWEMVRTMYYHADWWPVPTNEYQILEMNFNALYPPYTGCYECFSYRKFGMWDDWSGGWDFDAEEVREFDAAGRETKFTEWNFWLGEKLANWRTTWTYDANGNMIFQYGEEGDQSTENGFYWYSSVTREWENGVNNYVHIIFSPTSGREGDDYGYSDEYDFSVSQEYLHTMGGYNALYKLLHSYEFVTDGAGGWEDIWIKTFYWSQIEVEVSIKDELPNAKQSVIVYPNPVKDVLNIETEQTIKQIFVFDLAGKMLMHVQGDRRTINLQSLPTGNYIAKIHTDKGIVSVKIVKQ
ncbi:MAG: T9SS type A sorting domain-containing protein [Bacteroidales bacterium]|jgi:hypothetical protein|nr:T9SS type A sorting domain-containing protein [Bacteroidales bacterium]